MVAVIGLGLTGALSGVFIPYAVQSFSVYKCIKPSAASKGVFTPGRLNIIICLVSAAVWTLAAIHMESIFGAMLVSLLFGLSVLTALVDLKINVIPNELVLALSVVGIIFQASYYGLNSLLISILCMVIVAGLFAIVAWALGFSKVGAGDVKLAGVIGLVLGYPNIISALTIMSISLLLYSQIGLLTRKLTLRSMLPFAPFMVMGLIVTLVFIIL
ncbi:MAG: prepilin peptidase [Clostridiales bacterium]|nr:prepilin peptidase [Clostridiales bacterium]